ncbi:MAG: aldehyde dehydrogenase family protein [Rhizobiaceae bacterium]
MVKLSESLKNLVACLISTGEARVLNKIGGEPVPAQSGETFDNHSLVDAQFISRMAKIGSTDIGAAVKAAKNAFPAWQDISRADLKKVLHKIAYGIVARAEAYMEQKHIGFAISHHKIPQLGA